MIRARRLMLLLALTLPAPPIAAQSLEALRSAPLEISADEAEITRNGDMRYSGNVVFTSATLEARGDTLQLSRDGEGQVRVRISGDPAELEHRPEGKDMQPVDASAQSIDFDRATGVVQLRGAVAVQRAGDRISGEELRYEIVEQRITASGGDSGGRVRITIDPETLEGFEQ
ncbi:lipopolysaccharide transport periplasmic protein LptA [Algiphilus aromaticivorans]|uniref:lipopolysaccharide transport periplasmic protein LptA n=1 Tax=Algiphilus aromaticivorans TaxID=382454 RepID=UPI000A03FABE|nr:lipopolysaccharide transport periplasmic protein LptA [Algiphilus aromaticivorans]